MNGKVRVLAFQALAFPILVLAAGAMFFAGCAQQGNGAAWRQTLRENRTLQNAARAIMASQSFDRSTIATRNGETQEQRQAVQEAQAWLSPDFQNRVAERMVWEAIDFDTMAELKEGDSAQQLRKRAARKYRAALEFAPRFDSDDPRPLNALGYFLAERGQSESDFKQAERLTRRSLQLLDKQISDAPKDDGDALNGLRFSRANVRDSLAWALFRQGKHSTALQEQLASVKEAEEAAPKIKQTMPAELYYHLGEIYRAQKNFAAAKAQYQKALRVEPDHELSRSALENLRP